MSAVIQNIQPDRQKYIGSSDAAAILGVSPWKTPFTLYQEKIGEYREEITPAKQKIFDRGHRWEPIVIEMMVDELEDRGHEVKVIGRNRRFLDPEFDYMASEIDVELVVDGVLLNGEMKTVHPFAAKDWGQEGTDEIPLYYTSQILHGQMVTGRTRTVVAALIGADDLRVHFVDRDDEIIQILRAKEIEFWHRIQNREPPEPTSSEDINRLYRIDQGLTVEATDEVIELCKDLKVLKALIKQSETRADILATQIKSFMGNAAVLLYGNQKLATWKNNKNSVKTDWEAAFRALATDYAQKSKDDIEAYIKKATTTKTGARPLSIK